MINQKVYTTTAFILKLQKKATAIGNELASSLGIPVAAPEEGQE